MSEYSQMKDDAQQHNGRESILAQTRQKLRFDNVLNEKGTAVALKFPETSQPLVTDAKLDEEDLTDILNSGI